MGDIFKLICCAVIGLFRSRASLEAEILTLRQQLNVLRRKSPKRLAFSNVDRLIFGGLYQITWLGVTAHPCHYRKMNPAGAPRRIG